MPAGIAAIGTDGSFGRGTLGLDCPNCHHRHDYEDQRDSNGDIATCVWDCSDRCGCRADDFIAAKTAEIREMSGNIS